VYMYVGTARWQNSEMGYVRAGKIVAVLTPERVYSIFPVTDDLAS